MKPELHLWFAAKYGLPGVLAMSVVYPDKTGVSQVFSKSIAGKALDEIWRNVAEMAVSLHKLQMAAPCLRWLFADAWIYGSAREDGICLAVMTSKGLSVEERETVQRLLAEFQTI